MYYKSPFKSAIIREKQKAAFLCEIRCANLENIRKAKTAFLGEIRCANSENIRKVKAAFLCEIRCANSEKRQKSNIVNYRMNLRRGVFICPIG